jgi:hypothetical protein
LCLFRYGLTTNFIKSLKIPKLISHSIGHYLTVKQVLDEKNNFSIVEKINQLKNLIRCMKNKVHIIENVERKKKQLKILQSNLFLNKESKDFTLILRKGEDNNTYELLN